jgi:hypothetical protein
MRLMRLMLWKTWRPGMRPRIPVAAGVRTAVVTGACLLATACTTAPTTGTTRTTPPRSAPGALTATLLAATWRGTFQIDGLLTDSPAHVGSAGCTAIGYMALDLHRVATGTHGNSVSGRLRVWAVTTSGATGTACGRRDILQGSLLGTLSSDGNRLRTGSFHLLGVAYGWLTATIVSTAIGPTMQAQFSAGRRHHRSLRGSFTLARSDTPSDAVADSQPSTSPPTPTRS